MIKSTFTICMLLLLSTGAIAQSSYYRLFEKTTQDNSLQLNNMVEDYVDLSINTGSFDQIFSEKKENINVEIPISKEANATLILKKFNILTHDAKLIVRNGETETGQDINNIIVSYIGSIQGLPNSYVIMNFSVNGIDGIVITPNDRYVLGKSGQTESYAIYQESKLKIGSDFKCDVSDSDVPEAVRTMMKNTDRMKGGTDILDANIALDLDFATFNRFGSVANATAYSLGLMTSVSALYVREMNVKLSVPYVRVWTSADPYTGTGSNTILNQFRSTWNSTQQGVPRSLAHLISTRAGGLGGIAWLNVLCDGFVNGFGYGFSNTNGGYLTLPGYSWDVNVVAHEIGHNFGSPHTHDCGWSNGPIDTCYAVEGGCYSGPLHPKIGTIMSYCHLSAGITLDFGEQPRNLIRQGAENSGCLTPLNPQILVSYPNGRELFKTYTSMRIIWGAGFSGNINLEYTTNNGSTWTTIQNNLAADLRQYDWMIPNIDTTYQAKIRVVNSSNTSMSDISDSTFSILKNLTLAGLALVSPPSFTRVITSPSDTAMVTFKWRKAGFHPSIRYKWNIKKIGSPAEYFYTSDNSGVDTTFTVRKSFLDTLARANWGMNNDTVACTWRVKAYNVNDSAASNLNIVTLVDQTVGINPISSIVPDIFKLENNYPNPFNPETRISFSIPQESFVRLTVYDLLGREVSILVNEKVAPGSYAIPFNASQSKAQLSSGVYFYRIEAEHKGGNFIETKRMVLTK